MGGRGAALRYRVMHEDSKRRAWHAFALGVADNPYPATDLRHRYFNGKLRGFMRARPDVQRICALAGWDVVQYLLRLYPDPGPVAPVETLIESVLADSPPSRKGVYR